MNQIALTYIGGGIGSERPADVLRGGALELSSSVASPNALLAKRLRRLTNLRTGWDGYAAAPVSHLVAQFAWNILTSTMKPQTPPPAIVPVSGGGVQIEWHVAGFDVELYIMRPMYAELCIEHPDGRTEETELTSDFSALSNVLSEMEHEVASEPTLEMLA